MFAPSQRHSFPFFLSLWVWKFLINVFSLLFLCCLDISRFYCICKGWWKCITFKPNICIYEGKFEGFYAWDIFALLHYCSEYSEVQSCVGKLKLRTWRPMKANAVGAVLSFGDKKGWGSNVFCPVPLKGLCYSSNFRMARSALKVNCIVQEDNIMAMEWALYFRSGVQRSRKPCHLL